MQKINNEREYLVHLLHCAFNDKEPLKAEGLDYSALFALAKRHQVLAAIIPVAEKISDLPEDKKKELHLYAMNCIRAAIRLDSERGILFDELSDSGVRFMPLKGYLLRRYYPKVSMRQMGDIDIYYDESNRNIVADIMSENGYLNVSSSDNSDDYKKDNTLIFEFHRSLFYDEADFNPVFDHLWEHAVPDRENPMMYIMGVDDLYIHSVCHMYKHFTYGGCGIRFLADIYLMLREEKDSLDWEFIRAKMAEYGISEFEKTCRELAVAIFDGRELDREQSDLLNMFLDFGIFGNEKNKVGFRFKEFANGEEINAQMRRKYLFARLFPSKAKMIADYRILEKHIYLLPAVYAYRLIRATLNFKRTKQEIKYINDTE